MVKNYGNGKKKVVKKGKRRAAELRNGSDHGHRPYMAIVA